MMTNKYTGFKKDKSLLKNTLTDLQYRVTQQNGTETPFQNEYWDHKEVGIYVDIVSGEPLFASIHKFDSGTGWPSFYQSIDEAFVNLKRDFKMIIPRTEARSRSGDSHLGHVFKDGPAPTGQRYCINSAALKFVRKEDLQTMGYGEFEAIFNNKVASK